MARGSITPTVTKKGTVYRVVFDIGRDPVTGKRRQLRETVRTKKEAERLLSQRLAEIDRGEWSEPSSEPLGAYLDRWCDALAVAGRVKPATLYTYRAVLTKRYAALARLPLAQLTPAHLTKLNAEALASGLSANTISQGQTVLRMALKDAVREGLIRRNPTEAATVPRVRPYVPAVWSPEQVAVFLSHTSSDATWGVLWRAMATTLMREGELLALRWEDVDLERETARVVATRTRAADGRDVRGDSPKSASGVRTVPLLSGMAAALRSHRAQVAERRLAAGPAWQDHGLVFPAEDGRMRSVQKLGDAFHAAREACGLPYCRPYDLRHAGATALIAAGVPVKTVSRLLGHANITITLDRYIVPSQDEYRAAIDVLGKLLSDNTGEAEGNRA